MLASFSACTYGWPTGDGPLLDAGADGPTDASLDHAADVVDAAAADVAADAPPPKDGGPDSAPNCAALKAAVAAKHAVAKQCPNIGVPCLSKISDECDCEIWVLDGSAVAVSDYKAAVAALKAQASVCSISCPAGTCHPPVSNGACIIVEGGAAQECSP